MNCRAGQSRTLLPALLIVLIVCPCGRARSEKSSPPSAVALDQLSVSDGAQSSDRDRSSDVDVPQSVAVSRSASVIPSEISDRPDVRTLTIPPAVGSDRCDTRESGATAEMCRRRIETRAGQYSRPSAAPVTPEARLLLLTNPRATGSNGQGGNQPSTALDGANGPGEQLAGALRNGLGDQDVSASVPNSPAQPGILPIIVNPPK